MTRRGGRLESVNKMMQFSTCRWRHLVPMAAYTSDKAAKLQKSIYRSYNNICSYPGNIFFRETQGLMRFAYISFTFLTMSYFVLFLFFSKLCIKEKYFFCACCVRWFLGSVRPRNDVQPHIWSLVLDQQHCHQLRSACSQKE